MAYQSHEFTLDDSLQLNNRTTGNTVNTSIVGATSGGTAIVLDLGAQAPQYGGLTGASATTSPKAYGRFALVIDWAGIQAGAGQFYDMRVQGSVSDPTFGGAVYTLEQFVVGVAASSGQPVDTAPNCRKVLFFDNSALSSASTGGAPVTCRYIRLSVFCSNGGQTTGWDYKAWLVPLT